MSWPCVPLEKLYGEPSRNGLTRPKSVRGAGYKMVNMGELFAHDRLRNPEMERVSMSEPEIQKFSLHAGDLLFARQSLIASGAGKCSVVLLVPEITTFESHIIRVRLESERVDPLFYFYYFNSAQGKGNVQSLVMQVAAAGIRGSELAHLQVPFPPLPIQRRIGSILGAYDDLIENNLRRIRILEEMARLLYKEWFVDFRFPGHEKHGPRPASNEACKPTRPNTPGWIPSPLGPIPAGWEVKELGELVTQECKGVSPDAVDPDTPYVGLEHIPRKSVALSEWGRASDVDSMKYRFQKGDILFGKIRPYFHKVSVAHLDGICSSDTIVIRTRSHECFGPVMCCVSSAEFVDQATQTSNGTKMPRANWDVLVKYPVAMPPPGLRDHFTGMVDDIVTLIHNLVAKNGNLRHTRDLLLPKLVSGEVNVAPVEEEQPHDDRGPIYSAAGVHSVNHGKRR